MKVLLRTSMIPQVIPSSIVKHLDGEVSRRELRHDRKVVNIEICRKGIFRVWNEVFANN